MIYLVRHCITDKNRDKILIGNSDPDLNILGYKQADSISQYLRNKDIGKIYCSQMKRTMQTANKIGEIKGLSPVICSNLNERELGDFEGMGVNELIKLRLSRGHIFNDPTQDWHKISGVEQDNSIFSRINNCLSGTDLKNENIVVVTHAGAIKGYLYKLLNINPKTFNCFKIRYGTIVEINFVNSFPQITTIKEVLC